MAKPRPYGVGPYGTGPYERYKASLHVVGGSTGIVFGPVATAPSITICPQAITEIQFDAWQVGDDLSWPGLEPCEEGVWTPAGPCEAGAWAPAGDCADSAWAADTPEDGAWAATDDCGQGTWGKQRLEEVT